DVAVRRSRTNVEAAQFIFAAGVKAVLRRSHSAAKALHVTKLRTNTQHVVPVLRVQQVMHRQEPFVGDQRRKIANIAPQTGELERRRVLLTRTRTNRVIDGVVRVRKRELAAHDTVQRIVALDSGPEADGLEEGLRRRTESCDG